MATCRVLVASPPGSAAPLHTWNTCEEDHGSLAIVIKNWSNSKFRLPVSEDEDNNVAALEHPDHVGWIQMNKLAIRISEKCGFADADLTPCAHIPFSLVRRRGGANPFKFFLGGSVPHLQGFSLTGIPFPALPKTYLSASDLSSLQLLWIPSAGYVSPEVIVTCLSALTNLEMLRIEFHSSASHPTPGCTLLLSLRRALPTLIHLTFWGASEHLGDLMARIDPPPLSHVSITLFHQLVFQVPHLSQFISLTDILKSVRVIEVNSSSASGIITTTFD